VTRVSTRFGCRLLTLQDAPPDPESTEPRGFVGS
jgi:hypothetical protein